MRKIVPNKYFILLLLSLLLLLSGCKVKRPRHVLPEAKMEDVLYDYHLAKAMGDELPYNENYKKVMYIEYVFDKYGITQEQFDSSLIWYTRNTEVLHEIYEKINQRYKKEQDEISTLISIRDNKPKTSQPGDSIDVWVWDRIYHLSGSPLTNKMSFVLPSDTNFKARDTIVWTADYHFLANNPDSTETAIMAMQIQFSNDSVISTNKKIQQPGLHEIYLQSDTLGEIKEIKGFIYYPKQSDTIKALIVNDVSLYRYHSNDTTSVVSNTPASIIDEIAERPIEELEEIPDLLNIPDVIPEEVEDLKSVRRINRPRPGQKSQDE